MNKEHLLMIPLRDLIRVKICLIAPFSMSYPDVVIACMKYKVSLEAFRSN